MLTIRKASAGSGKTRTLTLEYLKLLLGRKAGEGDDAPYRLRPLSSYGSRKSKPHGEILAVTFTNKATEEMTTRIINELATLADPDGKSDYLDEFLEIFATDETTLRKHARRALADVLYNFSWFNVSTIDAFFQRVLNTFTRELELPPNRRVELDDKYALAVAVEKMLSSINTPLSADPAARRSRQYLESWLQQYMEAMVTDGRGFNLLSQTSSVNAGLISDLAGFFNEKYKLNRAEIDSYLSDHTRIEDFARAIAPRGIIAEKGKEVAAKCARAAALADDTVQKVLLTRLTAYGKGDFGTAPGKTFRLCAADPDGCFKKNTAPHPPQLLEALGEALTAAVEYFDLASLFSLLYGQIYQLGLFGRVHEYLEEFRRDNDSLLLSDTGDLLRRIISEDETPFIYERMGTAIHHYLIDEFQDTSQMQWENLKPLVLDSLGCGHDNLIIGDEKQCIYRFRNSDPRLLGNRVERLVASRFPKSLQMRGTSSDDNNNWRSSVDVVRFNNTLFRSMAGLFDAGDPAKPISAVYAGLIQYIHKKRKKFPGYVKVEFLPREREDAGDETPALQALQMQRLVAEIDRQLTAGYRPGEIAVLVRKKSQGRSVIAGLMDVMEHDINWKHGVIPVMSADSMAISISPAVRMIVNVLRLVTQPVLVTKPGGEVDAEGHPLQEENPAYRRYRLLHRFELCRFDTVQQTDADGNPVTDSDGKPVMRRLTDREALAKAVAATSVPAGGTTDARQMEIDAELTRLSEMDSPTLMAMTERIIGKFLTPDARRSENVFITAFQDLVMDYSDNGENNLNNFLDWWDRSGSQTNVAPPEGMDAINVFTIHKAKGLQYECVHIPFFSDPPVKYNSPMVKSLSWYRLDPAHLPGVSAECVPPFMPLPNMAANKDIPALRADALEWETEQRTDALNVAYVAFTRAISELCVYVDNMGTVPAPEKTKASPKWLMGDYLLASVREMTPGFLDGCDVPDEARPFLVPLSEGLHKTDDGELEFILGNPTSPRREKQQPAAAGGISPSASGAVSREETSRAAEEGVEDAKVDYDTLLDEYVVNEHSEIKAAMDFESLVNFDISNDDHRGTFLHSVLSRVRHISDLPKALSRQAYRYHLTPEETEMCRRVLEDALADKRARQWFEGFRKVITERPVSALNARRRPDRVVWLADGSVAVVDYKFGTHNPRTYQEQVRDYMNLLAATGCMGVKGYLWFPIKKEIIEV